MTEPNTIEAPKMSNLLNDLTPISHFNKTLKDFSPTNQNIKYFGGSGKRFFIHTKYGTVVSIVPINKPAKYNKNEVEYMNILKEEFITFVGGSALDSTVGDSVFDVLVSTIKKSIDSLTIIDMLWYNNVNLVNGSWAERLIEIQKYFKRKYDLKKFYTLLPESNNFESCHVKTGQIFVRSLLSSQEYTRESYFDVVNHGYINLAIVGCIDTVRQSSLIIDVTKRYATLSAVPKKLLDYMGIFSETYAASPLADETPDDDDLFNTFTRVYGIFSNMVTLFQTFVNEGGETDEILNNVYTTMSVLSARIDRERNIQILRQAAKKVYDASFTRDGFIKIEFESIEQQLTLADVDRKIVACCKYADLPNMELIPRFQEPEYGCINRSDSTWVLPADYFANMVQYQKFCIVKCKIPKKVRGVDAPRFFNDYEALSQSFNVNEFKRLDSFTDKFNQQNLEFNELFSELDDYINRWFNKTHKQDDWVNLVDVVNTLYNTLYTDNNNRQYDEQTWKLNLMREGGKREFYTKRRLSDGVDDSPAKILKYSPTQ